MSERKRFYCPCCGFDTLDAEPPGTFDICRICGWEDDDVQFEDPDFSGGANVLSLRKYQLNWSKSTYNHPIIQSETEIFGIKYNRKPGWKPLNN